MINWLQCRLRRGSRGRSSRLHTRGGGDATDDSALAEAAGYAVELVEGDPRNLKITDPHDLVVVQGLLDAGSHGHGEPGDRSAV